MDRSQIRRIVSSDANRILRRFPDHHDSFMRVSFTDDEHLQFRLIDQIERMDDIERNGYYFFCTPGQTSSARTKLRRHAMPLDFLESMGIECY